MYSYQYWGNHTLPAVDNMALEEFFLRKAADERTAHIRFYDFQGDTVVLGYNQATSALKQWANDFAVVRRGSGGSHVHLNDNILAYSFIIPRDGNFRNLNDFRAYYGQKVADSLEKMGLQDIIVDNKASTIMTGDRVIASHALTWGINSALLHGIVHITPYDVDKVMQRVNLGHRKIGNTIYTEASALRRLPALAHVLPNIKPNATPEQRQRHFKDLLSETILREVAGTDYTREELTDALIAQARAYREDKYSQPRWIKHRDPVFTPEEIEELPGEKLDGPLKHGWGYCLYIQVPDKDFKKMSEPED